MQCDVMRRNVGADLSCPSPIYRPPNNRFIRPHPSLSFYFTNVTPIQSLKFTTRSTGEEGTSIVPSSPLLQSGEGNSNRYILQW
jgi:hypothetical protein